LELGQHATDSQDWRPRQLKWEAIERVGKDKQRAPTVREQAIMAAHVELKLLSGPQVAASCPTRPSAPCATAARDVRAGLAAARAPAV
jgi:hypothetical protein